MTCNVRCALVLFCVLQLVTIIGKEIFDISGFLWTPVFLNICHLIFTITVLVGICRYIYKVLVIYSVWCLVWLAWNLFVICFCREVGLLHRDLPILKLGCNRSSLWSQYWCPPPNGDFATIEFTTDLIKLRISPEFLIGNEDTTTLLSMLSSDYDVDEPSSPMSTSPLDDESSETSTLLTSPSPSSTPYDGVNGVATTVDTSDGRVDEDYDDGSNVSTAMSDDRTVDMTYTDELSNCWKFYYIIEAIHAAVQCLLAVICFFLTCFLARIYSEEEDSSCLEFDFITGPLLSTSDKNDTQQRYQLKALYVPAGSP